VKRNKVARNELFLNAILPSDFQITNTFRVFNLQKNPNQIVVGKSSFIIGELLVFAYGGFIKIGEYSFVGEGTRIWSGENITIGNNVLISHNCNIVDTNSHEIDYLERAKGYKDLREVGYPILKGSIQTSEVIIEDYAWISFNTTILKGVTIGKGAIIGANSVVTEDIPPFTLSIGNPAKVIKNLT
jgi:acetyltransferase-like isoleucine patch superfamily enzyme